MQWSYYEKNETGAIEKPPFHFFSNSYFGYLLS